MKSEKHIEPEAPTILGRVVSEHRERYTVRTDAGEAEAEVSGHLRFEAKSRADFPVTGDWVELIPERPDFGIIHRVLPRKSLIERRSVGQFGEAQIIAANIDHAFITLAADRDFNINRVERYLTICHAAKVNPLLLLTKTDLVDEAELARLVNELSARLENLPVIPLSTHTGAGLDRLKALLKKGETYCFLGSSGVGKSTLINHLIGREALKTSPISASTGKGRHTTHYRELEFLENGSILVDNPGMREVGIADTSGGLETTFEAIVKIARNCKFSDCTHTHEKGCAVREAVEKGRINQASVQNYLKLEREKAQFHANVAEKRKKDRAFGKLCKQGMEHRKALKF